MAVLHGPCRKAAFSAGKRAPAGRGDSRPLWRLHLNVEGTRTTHLRGPSAARPARSPRRPGAWGWVRGCCPWYPARALQRPPERMKPENFAGDSGSFCWGAGSQSLGFARICSGLHCSMRRQEVGSEGPIVPAALSSTSRWGPARARQPRPARCPRPTRGVACLVPLGIPQK